MSKQETIETINGITVTITLESVNNNQEQLSATFSPETNWVFIKQAPSMPYPDGYDPSYADISYQLTNGSKSESSTSISVGKVKNSFPSEVWVWWEDSLQSDGTISDDGDVRPKPTERGTLVSIQS